MRTTSYGLICVSYRSYEVFFLLKGSLLKQSTKKKLNKKIKVWIVQGGQYVATYFWLVLECNTVAYIAVFITLFGKMTRQWNDKAHYCSD